jgi:anti-anti-sigma regulatory factor
VREDKEMGTELRCTVTQRPGETQVVLEGEITGAANLQRLRLIAPRVVLDLGGVRRINSAGVHRLSLFLEAAARSCSLEAVRCSPPVVTQLSLLPRLARHLRVRSVLVPLECPACFSEEEIVVDVAGSGRHPTIPARSCAACGETMILAEPEERYFAFLDE